MTSEQRLQETHRLSDQREREAALDCSRSIHCESPAGAGKTTLLTDRFLGLLASCDHPLQILALTFTNKAAAEMRQRIWDTLRSAEEGREGERHAIARQALARHKGYHHLIYSPDGLRIMTFHSLCLAIVRSSPFDAGISSDIGVIEGIEHDELLEQVTDDVLKGIGSLPKDDPRRLALEAWLLRSNNHWGRLRSDCMRLVERRDYLGDLIGLVGLHPDMDSFQHTINHDLEDLVTGFIARTRSAFLESDLAGNWREASQYLEPHHCGRDGGPPGVTWQDLPSWQSLVDRILTKQGTPRKQFPPGAKDPVAQEVGARLRRLPQETVQMLHDLRALPVHGYDRHQIQAIHDLVILVGEVITAWQEACLQKGIIDFVGLELACLRVFRKAEIPDIQLILDSSLRHILVDEFQDTSRNQWELLQRLCAGWSPGDGRTLFVVGDPKQSIYAFRKAEVSLFMEARNGLPVPGQGHIPLESISLRHNFRSAPGLVEWTNHLFGDTVMAHAREDIDEVPYSPATASIEGGHSLSLTIFCEGESVSDPQVAEAQWLAHSVAHLDAKAREGEVIGVLLFTRTRISLYLQAIRDIGLPVMVTEGITLGERIEVLCMHAMVRALVRPYDDVACAALLRAPWKWCNPGVLCRILLQPGATWTDRVGHYVNTGEGEWLRPWWEIIRRARMRVGRDSLAGIVKDAWLEMEGAYALASWTGAEGVANVLRYLELLEESDRVIPEETIERVERSLDRTYLPSPPEASRSRVSIMTVHKAKGLEFDHVFCPFLDWNPLSGGRSDQPPYLLETGKNGEGLLALRRDRRNGTQDPIYGLLRSREEGKRCAEAKRVLYVAVTRAKRGLHLSGAASWSNGRLCARSKHSPLAAVVAHEGIGAWDLSHPLEHDIRREGTCGMEIRINPPPSSERYSSPAIPPLPEPIPTTPEPVPYMVVNPSETRDFVPRPVEAPEQDHGPTKQERARGIVTHGILAGAAWGKEVPAEPAIAAALCAEGISPGQAGPLARSILDEVSRCMEEETCAWILDRGHPEAYAEWGIEDSPEAGVIRSGIVDRLIFDGSRWWIVDYKTVRTEGEDEGAVIDREALLYRPQMEAYRSMVSRWKGIVPDRIVLLLYFTAYRRAYRYP